MVPVFGVVMPKTVWVINAIERHQFVSMVVKPDGLDTIVTSVSICEF